ncbi:MULTISPECIES: alpha/beta fold hydrolase [Oceanobacillus]|uniref:alpha/beta fold hydrolase n=1 Tax=Oceanobacillus TaxID=182709 RepID=UPI00084E7DC9|nr:MULTISPECIES: alpha/beta fold hydrolase [Oceanobacillus]MBT2652742.1 alpha/beta fold hydrolase [Oceanobacillus sp. ISL-73]OEH53509.1 2-succinyl-6-hydroxy-2,4-cyclohexadiene-1-carboxylate synthase [Oceanobacillus sp. E9]
MRYIFIHGLGQNSSSWEKTISYLGETNKILRPNLFELLQDKEPTYNNLYLAFTEYVDKISEPVVIIGLSLGAVLALNFTIDHPHRVRSLVLIAPQYKMPKFLLTVQYNIFKFIPDSSFRKLGSNKDVFILLTKSMVELDFSEDVKRILCHTLVLCGNQDKANKRASERLARRIPKAKFREIEGAGHELNKDTPEKLASVLVEFLW